MKPKKIGLITKKIIMYLRIVIGVFSLYFRLIISLTTMAFLSIHGILELMNPIFYYVLLVGCIAFVFKPIFDYLFDF